MSADSSRAVFLSYASEDAAAARRVAAALRAAGVEVWFDQNELVGGDAWDAKIRGQIASCALFVPIISVATQARREGYFRLEWKLAAQRMHMIADGTPFLLPLVIDGTRDAEALVPAEFKAVQWTRLAEGRDVEKFCARVGALLDSNGDRGAAVVPGGELRRGGGSRRRGVWRWPAVAVGAAGVLALAWWSPWRARDAAAMAAAPLKASAGVATSETGAAVSALLGRAQVLMARTDVMRSDLDSAANLLAEAAKLEPTNARLWAERALVDRRYWAEYLDRSAARQASARRHAAQAASLDPELPLARLAQAAVMTIGQRDPATTVRAVQLLESVVDRIADRADAFYLLGELLAGRGELEAALRQLDRAAAMPGEAGRANVNRCWAFFRNGRMREADEAIDRALAAERSAIAKQVKAFFLAIWHSDAEAGRRLFADIPPEILAEDYAASAHFFIELWCGNPNGALTALRGVPREFIESQALSGPTGYYRGLAHARAGRRAAAEVEWRTALAVVQREMAARPNDEMLLTFLALLQWELGEQAAARKAWESLRELTGGGFTTWENYFLQMTMLPEDEAIAKLEQPSLFMAWRLAGTLRLDPYLERLRSRPRFQTLLARAEADPRLSPRAGRNATAEEKSVAVLAFANVGGDKDNEIFSDGISDELLNVLARIPGLKVSARTSAFFFKGKQVPMAEVARQLGVAYVVEGSVRKAGDKVRITTQLIKAADGFQVWSGTFTRELKDIFAVQDEIAGLIAKNLELTLAGRAAPAREIAPEAYQDYLSGRAAVAKAGMADLRQAVTHFERAVAKEPTFAAAWVQLAAANTQLGRWGGLPTREAWPAARAAIARARELDPESPDVWLALGWILRTADWDWRGAERAVRRAMALRPHHPDTLSAAAVLFFNLGQQAEAFQLGRQAARLDPLNPATQIDLGLMFFFSENWAEGEQAARRALQLSSAGHGYHAVLAWSLILQKRFAESEAELAREHSEIERLNGLGMLALARGQAAVAREHLASLESLARRDPDRADLQQSIAWMCAGLGEVDRAFAALEKAARSRDPSVAWSRTMWPLRGLYGDPRWIEFLRKLGLADDQLK